MKSHVSLPRSAIKRADLRLIMKDRYQDTEKVCDEFSPVHGPVEWRYLNGVYYRFDADKNLLARITAQNLPDPDRIMASRIEAARAFIKYVSAQTIERIAGQALNQGNDPEKALVDALTATRKPTEATRALWRHRNAQ